MRVFLKKLKNTKKGMKFTYFFALITYIVTLVLFTKSILSLVGIETVIRTILIIVFILYGLIYMVFALAKMFQNKRLGFTIISIITLLLALIFGFGSYYIDKLYGKLENLTTKETSTYTTVLLGLNGTSYDSDITIGLISDEKDRTGYILPLEFMKKEKMNNETKYYSNYTELIEALYNKEVDAIFITKDYKTIYGNEDKYQNIGTETTILKEYQKEMKTEESELLTSTKSLTEPFTVLVMGVDSDEKDGLDANAAFNGDTLILVTFNPKTLTATMFSIPRDLYVPIISSYGSQITTNKVNSSAAYGTASTVNTIKNLTGIDIDYFVKVNFQGVIDLVNTLGGIDVDVEAPDYDYYISQWGEGNLCESDANRTYIHPVCMKTGWQHLNGEQALAYARNRHGFLMSDLARNKHQQQIIEAVAKKLVKTSNFSEFEKLLDTVSNNIATNMKTSQILSFYQSLKGMLVQALNGEDFITIEKTQIQTFSFKNTYGLDCLGYYSGSLDAITTLMKENLGLTSIKTIKTFSYDYSEDYELDSETTGKGIYSGAKKPDQSIYGNYNNTTKNDKTESNSSDNYNNDDLDSDDDLDNSDNSNNNSNNSSNSSSNNNTNDTDNNNSNNNNNSSSNTNDNLSKNDDTKNDNSNSSSSSDNTGSDNSTSDTLPTIPGNPE